MRVHVQCLYVCMWCHPEHTNARIHTQTNPEPEPRLTDGCCHPRSPSLSLPISLPQSDASEVTPLSPGARSPPLSQHPSLRVPPFNQSPSGRRHNPSLSLPLSLPLSHSLLKIEAAPSVPQLHHAASVLARGTIRPTLLRWCS